MGLRRINLRQYHTIARGACIIFLLYTVLTPPIFNNTGSGVSDRSSPVSGIIRHASILAATITENETLTDVISYHIMNRTPQISRHLQSIVFHTLIISLTVYGILVHSSRCIRQIAIQHISVLAVSKGGHAPPLQI